MATIRKRGDTWQAQVRRKGHSPQVRTFLKKADAASWARQAEAELDQGVVAADPTKLRCLTLADLLARYERELTPRKKSQEVERYYLRAMARNAIGETTLESLTVARLARYRDERLKIVSPSSVRREFNVLRHCLEVAFREWDVGLTINPLKGLRMPPEAPARVRRVSPQELQALTTALQSSRNRLLAAVVNLAIFTGMRRSELLGMTWSNVDLKTGLVFLPTTKNGRSRIVPLSPSALDVLTALDRAKPNDNVLPISANAVRLSWERLKRRASIKNLHFHDLRHEAISRFFEIGLSVPEVALISGHRDPRMLLRYTHLSPAKVVERLSSIPIKSKQLLGDTLAEHSS